MTTKERIEKEAEDIVNKHYQDKFEAEAEAYADSVDRRGCSFWRGLKLGYLAGKKAEHERAQQELQAYRDMIEELIDYCEKSLIKYDDYKLIIKRARKLIDTVI